MRLIILILCFLILPLNAFADNRQQPVLLELYTSQRCPACPPADRLFNEMADEEGLVALALHVDYWDSPAAKDPWGAELNTNRQNKYAKNSPHKRLYTPQVIIGGQYQANGRNEGSIRRLIQKVKNENKNNFSIKINQTNDGALDIDILNKEKSHEIFDIWLFTVSKILKNTVNNKQITNRNIVRNIYRLGEFNEQSASFKLDVTKFDDVDMLAVVIQKSGLKAVVGSSLYSLK